MPEVVHGTFLHERAYLPGWSLLFFQGHLVPDVEVVEDFLAKHPTWRLTVSTGSMGVNILLEDK